MRGPDDLFMVEVSCAHLELAMLALAGQQAAAAAACFKAKLRYRYTMLKTCQHR
jgi:hypothetical protein